MQKTLFIKLSIIAGLCLIFTIGLTMFSSVIYERQNYADSVVREIAQQHVNPQEIITPFIAIPTTVTPECSIAANSTEQNKCAAAYSRVSTVFATQTMASQDLAVSNDTYQRGIYHATSYEGDIVFDQRYILTQNSLPVSTPTQTINDDDNNTTGNPVVTPAQTQRTQTHWDRVKLIIPVSDLRGVATLPTVTIGKQQLKATYPQDAMIQGLSYVEVALPQDFVAKLQAASLTVNRPNELQNNDSQKHALDITVNLPLSGINHLNTVPTGQNFELVMRSNWHAPNFIGKALPNAKDYTSKGFEASWQNQYLTVANNQYLSQCLSTANNECTVINRASLDDENISLRDPEAALMEASISADSLSLNSFGVSFAEPNDVYLQTERTMKYALLLILVSFGTFFLFEIIKSSRIHPIQYLLVGCALLVFYVLLLPLAEQIVFWQAYALAASACVGLIGWYTYYVLGGLKRAAIFTAILAGLYASFYGILTVEDLNLLLGAVFCFVLLAAVMVMTRKIDWYQVT